MGIYDRDYHRSGYSGYNTGVRFAMPSLTPVVKWLLIINFAVFVLTLIPSVGDLFRSWFAVSSLSVFQSFQLWRIITYQFLHSTNDAWHIIVNMLMLFFFGTMLERTWSSERFLKFYLICGAAGGLLYPILSHAGFPGMRPGYLFGASGAVLGVVAACVVLFPHAKVYVMGILPIPLFVLGGILVLVSLVGFLSGPNAGGEAAHLAGMATGVVYVLWQPWIQKTRVKMNKGKWEKKMAEERELFENVDQILEKVHNSGMKSLSRKEKKILKEATEREQHR